MPMSKVARMQLRALDYRIKHHTLLMNDGRTFGEYGALLQMRKEFIEQNTYKAKTI